MQLARIKNLAQFGLAIDTETHLLQAALKAPPLVCGSLAQYLQDAPVGGVFDKREIVEYFCEAIEDPNRVLLTANGSFDLLVIATELARMGVDVMPQIFAALDAGRVYDLQIAEAMHAIACGHLGKDPRTMAQLTNPETGRRGRYSLSTCLDLVLARQDAKANDEWRYRYAELENVPMPEWPRPALDYPVDDAVNTLLISLAQTGHIPKSSPRHLWGTNPDGSTACVDCGTTRFSAPCWVKRPHFNLNDHAPQVGTAFALHLGAAWGARVNHSTVDIIERHALRRREKLVMPFITAGVFRVADDGLHENQSVMKRLIAQAYGSRTLCSVCQGTGKVPSPSNPRSKINCIAVAEDGTKIKTCDGTGLVLADGVPRSDTGAVGISRDALHESGDEFLMSLGDYKEDAKVLKDYVPWFRKTRVQDPVTGVWSDIPLTLNPNPVLDTGRVSYDGYIMLLPRKPGFVDRETKEYIPSLRECIEPRPGHVFASIDYDSGELVAHAQSCIWITGHSQLANALIAEAKPHNALGATMIGQTYEEFQRRLKEGTLAEKLMCKDARQAAKPPNFGYPGGMGPVKLVHQQRSQGPDTPHVSGPSLIKDENGDMVPGYKGLRFCILMDKAAYCGDGRERGPDKRVIDWNGQRITPTCRQCIECAARLKEIWLRQWPENREYFRFVNDCLDNGMVITTDALVRWPHLQEWYSPGTRLEPGQIMQHHSGRLRGGLEYSALANGFFQGLLGDIAKSAVRRISRECYDRTWRVPYQARPNSNTSAYGGAQSPLYGQHLFAFLHDEVIPELREDVAHDAATRCSEIMIEEMRWYCPDLAPAVKAPPALMTRWLKGAEPVKNAQGRLIPWEPKLAAA